MGGVIQVHNSNVDDHSTSLTQLAAAAEDLASQMHGTLATLAAAGISGNADLGHQGTMAKMNQAIDQFKESANLSNKGMVAKQGDLNGADHQAMLAFNNVQVPTMRGV